MKALLAVLWLAALPEARAADAVDRVLAVVGHTPITSSAVVFETELRALLPSEPAACLESFGRLLCTAEAPIESLIFREILRQQGVAAEVEVAPSHAEERLLAFVLRFESRDGHDAFLARWALSESDARDLFVESVRLDRAVDVAVGRLVREISEDEERAYHAQHRDTLFAGQPYEAVAPIVSRQVYGLRFERTYDSWASELRAGARVRTMRR